MAATLIHRLLLAQNLHKSFFRGSHLWLLLLLTVGVLYGCLGFGHVFTFSPLLKLQSLLRRLDPDYLGRFRLLIFVFVCGLTSCFIALFLSCLTCRLLALFFGVFNTQYGVLRQRMLDDLL